MPTDDPLLLGHAPFRGGFLCLTNTTFLFQFKTMPDLAAKLSVVFHFVAGYQILIVIHFRFRSIEEVET
jgi:hypothetical protein